MSGFDCEQCLPRCKADCCRGPIPMPRALLEKHKPVRPLLRVDDIGGGMVIALAVDETQSTANPKPLYVEDQGSGQLVFGCCPFLGFDNRCTVYEDRPDVCREFGSESSIFMTCSYQASDGRVRARPERRRIEADQTKRREASLRDMRKLSDPTPAPMRLYPLPKL